MITDNENNWQYLAIKRVPGLLHGITSTNHGDVYCLNCFHSYRALNALKNHEKLCENHDYCKAKMPNEDNKYISSTLGKNSLRVPIVVYADFKCLLVQIDPCEKNPNISYTEKKDMHLPCEYSITTCYSYDKSLNKTKYCRGPDCVEKFSQDLKKIKKPMLPLTDNEKVLYANEKQCYICEKGFCTDKKSKDYKNKCKVRDRRHFTGNHRGAAHSICNLKYKVPKDIPVVFHNGSKYDNHLIIKQISKIFKGYFTCTGENTEKYISFSMNIIKKDINNKKKRPETYMLKFIDTYRFMASKLENLLINLVEPHKIDILKQRFPNTYRLCNNNIDKFELSLRKGVYPYEYMDSWEKFELSVPLDNKHYYSKLNDSNISDKDIEHVKNVSDALKIDHLGQYHDLYVQSDAALLTDVFENFRDKCLDIDKLVPAYFLSAPGLSWQCGLKMTGQTLELLTDENMLLLIEKGIRGGICETITKYKKTINKYMKNYDKTKASSYLMYVDANNLYGFAMSKNLPTGNFQWIEDTSIFTEDYIQNYNKNSDTGYLLVVDVTYPEDLNINTYHFYLRKSKLIKVLSYLVISMIKTVILYIFLH